MFHQQQPHLVPPLTAFQSELQAKEKLAVYVYEYLVLSGASKTAELFKQEKLAPQGIDANVALDSQPCFLQDWFSVFWDLYCASPDQRNRCESSWQAKAFHDRGFITPSLDPYPMENGMNAAQIGNYPHHLPGMPPNYAQPIQNGFYHPPSPMNHHSGPSPMNHHSGPSPMNHQPGPSPINHYPGPSPMNHQPGPCHMIHQLGPSHMNHHTGPSHLIAPINHSNRGRKRAKTEKPPERNFAESEESINRLRGPPPPYVPREQKPQSDKEEDQKMPLPVMVPLKTEEKIHNFIPTSCAGPLTLYPSASRFKPVVVPPRYEKPSIIKNVPARPKTPFHSYSPPKCSSEQMSAQKQQPGGDRISVPKESSSGSGSKENNYVDDVIKVDSEEDDSDSQIQELVNFMDDPDEDESSSSKTSSEPSP
ncbi:single-stranded DNA-binding protein 3 [Ditylenchus destructor]|uniref:Single-stranded DNA-binding protein 3 n=1 Tax=Ditylenchus destructor TaxID=166010 RepID=A0AAD4QXB6_9BILA|nr:single-stranded DNA-binding protein 3 [Ditylenchus destructor]